MHGLSREFKSLWAATTLSYFGALLGSLTLTALLYLHATPAQMGVLVACSTAPALPLAVFAGVWIDRLPARAVLRAAQLGRCALLLSVPATALLSILTMEHLYIVAFGEAALGIVFNLSYRSVLPSIVQPQELVAANARLRAGGATAESISPTVAGGVAQLTAAPVVPFLHALCLLASGLALSRLQHGAGRSQAAAETSMAREATTGLRTAIRDARLRALLGLSATYGFFGSFLIALYALRILQELGISPTGLGLLAVGGGAGALAGAVLAGPMVRRLGDGRALIAAYFLAVSFDLTIPLAGGPVWLAFAILFGGQLFGNTFYVVENVTSLSLRQRLTPPEQLGRVNAVFLTANQSLRPIGALVAGFTAEALGVQVGLLIGAAGVIAASLWLILSPLRRE